MVVVGQLTTDSSGTVDAFTFVGAAIQHISNSDDRDLFVIDIPFQTSPLAMDFVDTVGTITLTGKLITPPGGADTDAYNTTTGGGCLSQLTRLRNLAVPSGDGIQSTLYFSSTAYGGIYSNVAVMIQQFQFDVSMEEPVAVISYSMQLKRVTP